MNSRTPKQISAKDLDHWLQNEAQQPLLIDVREDHEIKIAAFPFQVLHLPLSKFSSWAETFSQKIPLERPLVVICHSGIRSMNFGTWLLEKNSHYEIWNLEGGIDSWSLTIDSSLPRY